VSEICSVKFDGIEVGRDGHVVCSWAKYHYIDLKFLCDVWWPYSCREVFRTKVDGITQWETSIIEFPGRGVLPPSCQLTSFTLPDAGDILSPGDHMIVIEAVEDSHVIDTYTFTVSVEKDPEQTQPYQRPSIARPDLMDILNKSYFGIPLWGWISIGIVGVAIVTKQPEEYKELKELMKLKLMKELAEEE